MGKCSWENPKSNCAAQAIKFEHQKDQQIANGNGKYERPLQVAVNANHPSAVKWLAEHNADLNATDASGRTPLHNALDQNIDAVKALIAAGADIDYKWAAREEPIYRVIKNSQPAIIKALIESGKINLDNQLQGGKTPLQVARQVVEIKTGYFLRRPDIDCEKAKQIVSILEKAQQAKAPIFSKCYWFSSACN